MRLWSAWTFARRAAFISRPGCPNRFDAPRIKARIRRIAPVSLHLAHFFFFLFLLCSFSFWSVCERKQRRLVVVVVALSPSPTWLLSSEGATRTLRRWCGSNGVGRRLVCIEAEVSGFFASSSEGQNGAQMGDERVCRQHFFKNLFILSALLGAITGVGRNARKRETRSLRPKQHT